MLFILDFKIIHSPGHTTGSLCVLFDAKFKENESKEVEDTTSSVLFTGDLIMYSEEKKRLDGYKKYNKCQPWLQSRSMKMLANKDLTYSWILPAHGRMMRFETQEQRIKAVLVATRAFDKNESMIGRYTIGYY